MPIPKIIHQTFSARRDMPDFLVENARKLQAMNPAWEYRIYEDADCERFVLDNFDKATWTLFQSIHRDYGAARADCFRYLLLYRLGGVYLDIKSSCSVPLDSFLRQDDEFLLSHWRDPRDGYHPEFGVDSEFQQWHILARAGHPFLDAVISRVSENLRNYDPVSDGVGKRAVLQMTGPIAYTRAIMPLIGRYPYRLFEAEMTGVTYSIAPMRHDKIFRKHYSKVTRPLVRFAFVRKDYLSPKILALLLMYLNGRFYKFLRKAFSRLGK